MPCSHQWISRPASQQQGSIRSTTIIRMAGSRARPSRLTSILFYPTCGATTCPLSLQAAITSRSPFADGMWG